MHCITGVEVIRVRSSNLTRLKGLLGNQKTFHEPLILVTLI